VLATDNFNAARDLLTRTILQSFVPILSALKVVAKGNAADQVDYGFAATGEGVDSHIVINFPVSPVEHLVYHPLRLF